MDPNANLTEMRKLAAKLVEACVPGAAFSDSTHGPNDLLSFETDVNRLAELVEALDEWLTQGGFLPHAWVQAEAPDDRRSR